MISVPVKGTTLLGSVGWFLSVLQFIKIVHKSMDSGINNKPELLEKT